MPQSPRIPAAAAKSHIRAAQRSEADQVALLDDVCVCLNRISEDIKRCSLCGRRVNLRLEEAYGAVALAETLASKSAA